MGLLPQAVVPAEAGTQAEFAMTYRQQFLMLSMGSRFRGNDVLVVRADDGHYWLYFVTRVSSPLSALKPLNPYIVSPNSSRPISMRRISLVPAPIS
jgi:hypothetical protein